MARNPQPPNSGNSGARLAKTTVHEEMSWAGPLPPPGALAQFNSIIPDGANRILVMAESQSAHREDIEKRVIQANIANQSRSSWFAFCIVVITVLGGFWLIHEGKDIIGMASILAPLAGVIGVFFYSKKEQRKERTAKSQALEKRRKG